MILSTCTEKPPRNAYVRGGLHGFVGNSFLFSAFDLFGNPRGELLEGHGAEVLARAGTHGDLAALGLAVADDEHVGQLLHLRLTDLVSDFLISEVSLHPHAEGGELPATCFAYSALRSVMGMTLTCSGLSHTGKAPA